MVRPTKNITMLGNEYKLGHKMAMFSLYVLMSICALVPMGCTSTKYVVVDCHPLSDFKRVKMVDYRTVNDTIFDSIQYRDYLLSFSDTSDTAIISDVFLLEKIYLFDQGLILIVDNGYSKYEVIVLVDNPSSNAKRIAAGKYYCMQVKPYFLRKGMYVSDVRKEIYHEHYVIMPAYLLHNEDCICTACLANIIECGDGKMLKYKIAS